MPDPTPTPAPEPTGAVGMRPMVVSEEEAAELRRLASENTAPPKIEPKRVAGGTLAPEDGAPRKRKPTLRDEITDLRRQLDQARADKAYWERWCTRHEVIESAALDKAGVLRYAGEASLTVCGRIELLARERDALRERIDGLDAQVARLREEIREWDEAYQEKMCEESAAELRAEQAERERDGLRQALVDVLGAMTDPDHRLNRRDDAWRRAPSAWVDFLRDALGDRG